MDTSPTKPPYTLLECAYRHLTRELCRALPPPRTEAEREDRDKAAIAQVSALQPDNTAEFQLAALFVEASARAQHCQTLADAPDCTTTHALKWIAKADLMMRQAQSAMRSLLRLQAARRKIEADPKAYDRGERIEHTMTTLMTQALEPNVSPDDPEPQNHVIEILPRQPEPAVTPTAQPEPPPTPQSVSPHDPESQNHVIEIPPRQPEPAPTQRWRPARPGHDFPLSDLAKEKEYEDAL